MSFDILDDYILFLNREKFNKIIAKRQSALYHDDDCIRVHPDTARYQCTCGAWEASIFYSLMLEEVN